MGRIDYPIYEMENKKCLKPPTIIMFIEINLYSKQHVVEKPDFQAHQVLAIAPSLSSN